MKIIKTIEQLNQSYKENNRVFKNLFVKDLYVFWDDTKPSRILIENCVFLNCKIQFDYRRLTDNFRFIEISGKFILIDCKIESIRPIAIHKRSESEGCAISFKNCKMEDVILTHTDKTYFISVVGTSLRELRICTQFEPVKSNIFLSDNMIRNLSMSYLLKSIKLVNNNIFHTNIRKCDFSSNEIRMFFQKNKFYTIEFNELIFEDMDLSGIDFGNTSFEFCVIKRCNVDGCDFSKCRYKYHHVVQDSNLFMDTDTTKAIFIR